ncbi:MazG-like family protein [Sphaerisporangium sp. NPDC049003]|uniref:MazG-like family protein n=1 Tax=Sphaerisporangium sp. NPDC049003 TaxID=3364517 RepID=UPI00371ADC05
MDAEAWETVDRLVAWLDAESALAPDVELLLRFMKLSEETGEVTEAVIGVLGQNPRKGLTHTWDDVDSELCDVILTAMVALRTRNPDAANIFKAHMASVASRSLTTTNRPPHSRENPPRARPVVRAQPAGSTVRGAVNPTFD